LDRRRSVRSTSFTAGRLGSHRLDQPDAAIGIAGVTHKLHAWRRGCQCEHARFPLARLGAEYRKVQIERRKVPDTPDAMAPIVRAAADISVIVVGGAGKHSSWQPTFGDGTRPVRRTIARKDGTPLRRAADLRR
jgi:hypothetical protein